MDSGNQGVGLGGAAPKEPREQHWNYQTGEKFTCSSWGLYIMGFHSVSNIFLHSLRLLALSLPCFLPSGKSTWFPPVEFNPILHSSTRLSWGDWESVRKLLLPQICKVKHCITLSPLCSWQAAWAGCLLSASACRFGLHFANTSPVQAWGGQACASRLSAALVLFCLETQAAGSCPLQHLNENENVRLTGHY